MPQNYIPAFLFIGVVGILMPLTLWIAKLVRPDNPHKTKLMTVTGKLAWTGHPMLEHFRFLDRTTKATAKMTIPSPMMLTSPTRSPSRARSRTRPS